VKTISIKHRRTGAVLYSTEVADDDDAYPIRTAVQRAILADADLAHADLARADLARAYLARADLAGADLADANLADANLAGANLAGANLAGAILARADLAHANLADADLADANLADADLARAYLARADLAGARSVPAGIAATDPAEPYVRKPSAQIDLERARRYSEAHPDVPVVDRLDAKILEAVTSGGGKLEMSTWHTCETAHCRAGWAIHLAGTAGYELERKLGNSERAGRAIYRASTGRVPWFYASNEQALEDIKRCAATAAIVAEAGGGGS